MGLLSNSWTSADGRLVLLLEDCVSYKKSCLWFLQGRRCPSFSSQDADGTRASLDKAVRNVNVNEEADLHVWTKIFCAQVCVSMFANVSQCLFSALKIFIFQHFIEYFNLLIPIPRVNRERGYQTAEWLITTKQTTVCQNDRKPCRPPYIEQH